MTTFLPLALAGVQKLVPYVPGKPIDELQRELGLTHIVKLASNENPLGTSQRVKAAIQEALADIHLYPDGSGFALKAALATQLGVAAEQLTLGNGSSEILELVVRAFVAPEHEVVFSQHAFALYPILTQAVGAQAKVIPAQDFGHDLTAMRAAINQRTRLVFIANPNNPTGTLLSPSALQDFVASLPAEVLCVLDEAYFEFVPTELRSDTLSWSNLYPNLIVARTFSKAYGLAGLRVGYGITHVEVADILNRIRAPFNNNALALAAAEAALVDSAYLAQTLAVNQAGMLQLTAAFTDLNLDWIPSSGNFVSVNVKQSGAVVYEALLRKGVIVRPVANYELPNYIRISIGTADENQVFIQALTQVLSGV
jgi:histidinol-phosphate aminotransferase